MNAYPSTAITLAELMAATGLSYCYGVAGSGNFVISHALTTFGTEYVPAMHESNAVMMAYGHARTTQELIAASVHSGPGLTNALTAIAEAAKGGVPLLVLAGDVAAGDVRSNFCFEQAKMIESVGAVAERVYSPDSAVRDLCRALKRVVRGGETVVLSLPEDVQNAPHTTHVDFKSLVRDIKSDTFLPIRTVPDPDVLEILADAVERSQYPLILAGRGAIRARTSLLSLAQDLEALLATSLAAHGLFAGDDWSVGISGGFASPAGLELLPQCDLILGFGVSFTHWTTRQGRLINPHATLAQIDNTLSRLGAHRLIDIPVLGDAELTARALHQVLRRRGIRTRSKWRKDNATRATISQYGKHVAPKSASDGPECLDPRLLTYAINNILPTERTIVTDAGHFMGWPPLYLSPPDAEGWCMPTAFQSVGLALGCAIGVSVARPDRLVVLAIGDGGLMMSMSDFASAISSRQRMCIIVYNDSAYSAELHYFKHRGLETDIVTFPTYDFATIAKAYGAEAVTVRCTADLTRLKDWIDRGSPGVLLLDSRVDRSIEGAWFRDAFTQPIKLSKATSHLSTAAE